LNGSPVERGERRGLAAAILRWSVPAGLFLLAFAVRAMSWATVLGPHRVHFRGADAYYHMRRILYLLANFPSGFEFDRYINFPHGAKPIWPIFFDAIIALLVRPFYRADDSLAVERVVVWVPVLLGAGTVLALYFLARRYFGFHVAWIAGLFLCILPGHFWYSQIGFLDHHAAVSLVSTLLLAAAMGFLARFTTSPSGGGAVLLAAIVTGVMLACSLLLWPGSLLHVGLVELGLVVFLLSRPTRDDAARFAGLLALAHVIAFLLVLPSGATSSWPQWSDFSPVVLSRFQPWLFGALAAYAGTCAALWKWTAVGRTFRARLVQAVAVGVLLLTASGIVFPDLRHAAADPWEWFAKRETFQAMVAESRALFSTRQGWTTRFAELRLSRFLYLFPICAVAFGFWIRGQRDRPALSLLLGWSLALAVATVVQKRFSNSFSVVLVLLTAWCCVRAYALLPGLLRASRIRRLAGRAVLLALIVLLLWPTFGTHYLPIQNQIEALRGQTLTIMEPATVQMRMLVLAAEWLRRNTPHTSGFLNAAERPEYGVLARCSNGHVLEYVGRRPAVTDNFGDDIGEENFRLSFAYFEAGEQEAVGILERLKVRYVLAEHRPAQDPAGRPSMSHRLSENGLGLRQHRLIFETPGLQPGGPPVYRVYEYVKGARVVGRAAPGTEVSASLRYRTSLQRPGVFQTAARADRGGTYTLWLPYSTRGTPPALRTQAFYVLQAAGQTAPLFVDEWAVQRGARITGPDFGP